jgi:hypothetical protein
MRNALIAIVLGACALLATPAHAVAPDPQFTQQMYDEIAAHKDATLGRIIATGVYPTDQQYHDAWCDALMWWKMSHPGGEAQLTMQGLIHLRDLEWRCRQRMRRAPVLPTEPQTPPVTQTTELEGGAINEAVQDYMRWHPEEFEDAPTLRDYILRRLLWWNMFGEGGRLADNHGAHRRAGLDGNASARAYDEAEAAEIARAEAEWRARHPGAADPPYNPHYTPSPEESAGGRYRDAVPEVWIGPGGANSTPPDFEGLPRWRQVLILEWESRTADGSVDPLDAAADRSAQGSVDPLDQARRSITVGVNDAVGSGARRREQVVGAATNAIGGVLGVGGGGRGPELERCRVRDRDMARFENGEVVLDAFARRNGNTVTVFADIVSSPDSGTFQTALLMNQHGQALAPADVGICDLYGQWRLSVSWTQTTYQNGQQVGQDSGGWSETGQLRVPGMENPANAPDGLWKRLGFSNASHGARRVVMTFEIPADQLSRDGAVLILHVTRPGQDPVTTVPFSLILEETPAGIVLARCP